MPARTYCTRRHDNGMDRSPHSQRRALERARRDGSTPAARSAAATPSDGSTRLSVRTNGTVWRSGPSGSRTNRLWPNPDAACEPAAANGANSDAPLVDARRPAADIRRRARFRRLTFAVKGRVGQRDHVSGSFDGISEGLVGFARLTTSCCRTSNPVCGSGLGKVDVVDDDLRRPAREVIDRASRARRAATASGRRSGSRFRSDTSSISTSAMSLRAVSGRAVCVRRQS